MGKSWNLGIGLDCGVGQIPICPYRLMFALQFQSAPTIIVVELLLGFGRWNLGILLILYSGGFPSSPTIIDEIVLGGVVVGTEGVGEDAGFLGTVDAFVLYCFGGEAGVGEGGETETGGF